MIVYKYNAEYASEVMTKIPYIFLFFYIKI